jgi:hypothetical protein
MKISLYNHHTGVSNGSGISPQGSSKVTLWVEEKVNGAVQKFASINNVLLTMGGGI